MIRVAVIDSGVHAAHPHVNGVAGGVGIDLDGREHDDFVDRLGHGTAVTAAIREKAPRAEILAVKVFDHELSAPIQALVAGCDWAIRQRATVLNLSLGTLNSDHADALTGVVARAAAAGAVIIAAGDQNGSHWLPGSLRGVWAVTLDWTLPRDRCHPAVSPEEQVSFRASGFPRPIPGVPPKRNLKGLSFAVANVTGLLAALFDAESTDETALERLQRAMANGWVG